MGSAGWGVLMRGVEAFDGVAADQRAMGSPEGCFGGLLQGSGCVGVGRAGGDGSGRATSRATAASCLEVHLPPSRQAMETDKKVDEPPAQLPPPRFTPHVIMSYTTGGVP